jgi:hypothetical protein
MKDKNKGESAMILGFLGCTLDSGTAFAEIKDCGRGPGLEVMVGILHSTLFKLRGKSGLQI